MRRTVILTAIAVALSPLFSPVREADAAVNAGSGTWCWQCLYFDDHWDYIPGTDQWVWAPIWYCDQLSGTEGFVECDDSSEWIPDGPDAWTWHSECVPSGTSVGCLGTIGSAPSPSDLAANGRVAVLSHVISVNGEERGCGDLLVAKAYTHDDISRLRRESGTLTF